jgi:hypothetical protein
MKKLAAYCSRAILMQEISVVNSQPNKSIENIDVDIIAAHWQLLKNGHPSRHVVIATENIKDFNKLCDVDSWRNVTF